MVMLIGWWTIGGLTPAFNHLWVRAAKVSIFLTKKCDVHHG
jgi:hypothetical protein